MTTLREIAERLAMSWWDIHQADHAESVSMLLERAMRLAIEASKQSYFGTESEICARMAELLKADAHK
jgi:hypothetical protein